MKIAPIFCVTAIAIVFIHDVVGPIMLVNAQIDLAREIRATQKEAAKPSIEIIPEPHFRVTPELRKENL
jgi:hypothetical protein